MALALSTLSASFVLSALRGAFADVGVQTYSTLYQAGLYGDAPSQRYFSEPEIWSPIFSVPKWNRSALSIKETPHILASFEYQSRMGPYIFSGEDLSLVYTDRSFPLVNNVRVQRYKGGRVLTFWAGIQGKGHAQGHCIALDKHYELVFNVTSSDAFAADADLHECEITKDDTVLVTIYELTPHFDLSSVGGKVDDVLLDSCFQEIDPETGNALFSWRASQHFLPNASYHDYEPRTHDGWDAWHINSLQKSKDGHYIVDLRRAHTVSLIDGTDGRPIWGLGGKGNSFEDISNGSTEFAWQHHTRFLDGDLTHLTLFDNHHLQDASGCTGRGCSRGLRLRLTHEPRRIVQLVGEHLAPAGLVSFAMGSYDLLPNGNVVIGWGSQAGFTEYDSYGNVVADVAFGRYNRYMRTYRVFKDRWVGLPSWNPKLALDSVTGGVLASWNGATEVRSWVVMAADKRESLVRFETLSMAGRSATVHAVRKGFETHVAVGDVLDSFKYVRAAALDAEGIVIGASAIVSVGDSDTIDVTQSLDNLFFSHKYNAVVSQYYKRPRG